MKILLVEDDQSLGEMLSLSLTSNHYTVDLAADGEVGLELACLWKYDLVILDLHLPKLDGLSVCRQLRSKGLVVPILILTSQNSNQEVATGLDAGADDYLVKPFNLDELLARIRALLRRGNTETTSPVLVWGNLCLDPSIAQVTYLDRIVAARPKEYVLLELLLRCPHQIFSRDAIIDRLWTADDCPTKHAVTNLIKDLRHRLNDAGMTEELIETVYGIGYRVKVPPQTANHQSQTLVLKNTGDQEKQLDQTSSDFHNSPEFTKIRARFKESLEGSMVLLSAEVQDENIRFAIKDQGRGIPPDHLEKIFGRFQQIDVSDSRQKVGTGLGLAICKSIVQQHGGQIWVESILGEGSTFYFTLPVDRTDR